MRSIITSQLTIIISVFTQIHPYTSNIYKQLEGPCAILRGMDDYTDDEINAFPILVTSAPHL